MTSDIEIWKVRSRKCYSKASNHLFIGQVLETNDVWVRMKCRTFHFGRLTGSSKDIVVGDVAVRVIPWGNIEVINVLDENFDYENGKIQVLEENMHFAYADKKHAYTIFKRKVGY